MVPALRSLGLDPARIRYVVITPSHGDHYGGAAFIRDTHGARLVSSAEDRAAVDAMHAAGKTVGPFALPPVRDLGLGEGEQFKVGSITLQFHLKPRHTVSCFRGFGSPREPTVRYTRIASMNRFSALAARAGADAMIANHPLQDGAFEKLELLRYRLPGDANPFVIGPSRLKRHFDVQVACSGLGLVRAGLDPERGDPR